MEAVGVEMDKDEVYPIMEDWMSNKLEKSHISACVSPVALVDALSHALTSPFPPG